MDPQAVTIHVIEQDVDARRIVNAMVAKAASFYEAVDLTGVVSTAVMDTLMILSGAIPLAAFEPSTT